MANNLKFFSFNLVDQVSTVITASSEDSLFPASNIKSPHSTKVYRSVSGTTTANVVFDFKTIEPVDSILVRGDSLDGFGFSGSLTIEANATNEWSSPAFTTTLSPNMQFNLGLLTLGTVQSYRFWRITGTGGQYFELSNLFIGSFTQLNNNNIDFGWTFENKDNSTFTSNRYKQRFTDKISNQKSIRANFKLLSIAEVETIMEVVDYHGKHLPVWIVLNESELIINDLERFAGMFYFRSRPSFKNGSFGLYDMGFMVEEGL